MNKGRIMIVEDEGITALSIQRKLETLGYEVPVAVGSGEEAVEQAEQAAPDLVLMDIRLAGEMDGVEAADQIKTQFDIPVVYLTAYADEDTFQRAKVTESFGYLLKPFQERILEITIEMALYKHKMDQALRTHSKHLEERVQERTQELEQALQDLQESQQKLIHQEKLATLGELAGGVAHELRNPLAVISNAVFYLRATLTEADQTTLEYLKIIEDRVYEAKKIVSDLLDFTRDRAVQRARATLAEMVEITLHRQPPSEQVQVSSFLPDDLPKVWVDAPQIIQVLTNLITNAYQAMPEGGDLILRAQAVDNGVCLAIADTGEGISADLLPKIFEPLFSTKVHGIGLGLAVSKNLVEGNGGRIEVESVAGVGSTFTLILPTVDKL